MTINQLKAMTKREYGLWFSNAKTSDLKELLNNENKGGGISKFSKGDLISVVMDLVDGVETELTKQLKPKREVKPIHNAERTYREMMRKHFTSTRFVFPPVYSQMGFFRNGLKSYADAKKEYLMLVKYFHPDKPTGNEEKFRKIQEAWENAELEFKELEPHQGRDLNEMFKGGI